VRGQWFGQQSGRQVVRNRRRFRRRGGQRAWRLVILASGGGVREGAVWAAVWGRQVVCVALGHEGGLRRAATVQDVLG